eukprot:2077378-Pyramimonas_sp.AAC.1
MWEVRSAPDASSDNSGISPGIRTCTDGKQWQQALPLLSERQEAKVEPSVISCSSGISACTKKASSGSGPSRCSARCGRR